VVSKILAVLPVLVVRVGARAVVSHFMTVPLLSTKIMIALWPTQTPPFCVLSIEYFAIVLKPSATKGNEGFEDSVRFVT